MRLGLLALGVAFVLMVWIFNKFQERRVRRRVEAPFAQPRRDVLFENGGFEQRPAQGLAPVGGRTEPSFSEASGAVDGAALEPSFTLPAHEEPAGERAVPIDESIHVLIPLTIDQPVSGDRVLASLTGLRHAGRQQVLVQGERDAAWFPVRTLQRYDALRVAIQLANRSGPLNEVEFSEFVTRLAAAAEQIPASCDVPDMIETIGRARALDACCAPLDSQIGVTLANPGGAWAGELLAEQAEALGMVLRGDGRFHAVLEDGTSLFVLQNADGPAFRIDNLATLASARVTFVLDLPRVPEALTPYGRMTRAAQSMAATLGALIVDDQLRTLTPALLESIGQQIEPVYAKLEAAGMPAGSARALALFS